ncbi:hypothetical protein TNCT_115581 [Trichonephila clavata]|uniref:Uncharacterized protein n=1 Tax=Trichonephila clavata TaxID=2740835 RepID=A0A8X6H3N0_TRICU|nr:hypothetical protein TNCT_115581 [Trichonephila clavata]
MLHSSPLPKGQILDSLAPWQALQLRYIHMYSVTLPLYPLMLNINVSPLEEMRYHQCVGVVKRKQGGRFCVSHGLVVKLFLI